MQKNKVLIIWSSEWPWDIRLDKEIKALKQDKNIEISIIARNSSQKENYEVIDNVNIYRVGNYLQNVKLDKILSTPIYINPLWIFKIFNTIKNIRPNIILIREIPLAPIAIFIAKLFNIKVVLDVAEHFPALMRVTKKYTNNPFLKLLICKLGWYEWIEEYSVENCEKVLVVVEESRDRLIKQYNIPKDKIKIVSNTPIIIPTTSIEHLNDPKLKIVYTGNVDGAFRGIQTVLGAAEILKTNPNIEFNIIGNGTAWNEIKEQKINLNLNNINLLGRFEHEKLLEFLKTQSLGIVPHTKSDVIEYTIPNKLFDYMSYSLPVIVSSATPLKRIVEETNCGYVFEADNPQSLAMLILSLLDKKQELAEKAKNGYNAVKDKYNWENDANTFLNVIYDILSEREAKNV